jgi:hypothetical protein
MFTPDTTYPLPFCGDDGVQLRLTVRPSGALAGAVGEYSAVVLSVLAFAVLASTAAVTSRAWGLTSPTTRLSNASRALPITAAGAP